MRALFENWRKYVNEVDTDGDGIDDAKELAVIDRGELDTPVASSRTYNIIKDDGKALFFEDEFTKELDFRSPFIKEIAAAGRNKWGFSYVRRLKLRPDGGTDPSDQPVFVYHGNRQYIETMKGIASKHGIIII